MTDRVAGAWGVRAVGSALLALLLLRAVTAFVPSMWAWGLNDQRFLPPLVAWIPWIAAVLTLHPAVTGRVATWLDRIGARVATGRRTPWLAALAGAALVWVFPDRLWFTGDFLLRQGAAESGAFAGTFVQSLPVEVFLHRTLPGVLGAGSPLDPHVVNRALGALAAAGLAMVAVLLVREWELDGSAALVGAATVFCGGYLVTFTGLGKPAALMCLATALCLLAATRLVRSGSGAGLLGATLGVALLTHRSAIALVPLWAATLGCLLARPDGPRFRGRSGRTLLVAGGLPLASAAVAGPLILGIVRHFDLPRHLSPPEVAGRGIVAAALAPLHLVDLANLLVFLTPAPLIALVVLACVRPRTAPRAAAWLAGVPALSFVPVVLFVHPTQGIFRDLEVFAAAGVAAALAAARVIGAALGRARLPVGLPGRLAPGLLAIVLLSALHALVLFNDPESGLRRVRSYATEAPRRDARELAQLWDGIAYRAFRQRDWPTALEASDRSARYAPHPRALAMLALARTYTGDHRGAESLYVALAERTPEDPLVWLGLGGAALRVGDSVQSARALARLESYAPDSPEARLIRRHLRMFPEAWPIAPRVGAGGEGRTGR